MITPECYRDKVLGGWLGKNIGGTLGGPWEGHTEPLQLYFYDPVPKEPMPNDDFEIQLVWLDMVARKSIYLTPHHFMEQWRARTLYYIAEYFNGQRHMVMNLMPPASGAFNNWWINGMGAAIRSELWGMLAPGLPDIAAAYAYLDASTDHADCGLHGEMLFAAIESAAFMERDREKLVATALTFIPAGSRVHEVARLVMDELRRGTEPRRIRNLICSRFAHASDFTYVLANIGFILLGMLGGEDYGQSLCDTVNCGYDTDCTGATLGAILGIINGASGTPPEWLAPVGMMVKVSDFIPGVVYGETLNEVTDQVCAHGKQVLENEDAVRRHLYKWTGLPFLKPSGAVSAPLPPSFNTHLAVGNAISLTAEYGGTPAIGFDEEKEIHLTLKNELETSAAGVLRLTMGDDLDAAFTGQPYSKSTSVDITLPAAGTVTLPFHVRMDAKAPARTHASLNVRFEAGAECLDAVLGLPRKACWRVTAPMSPEDGRAIEAKGVLCAGATSMQLDTETITALVPAEGLVVYAQTDYFAEEDVEVRLMANNTGPVWVWLNGAMIIDKPHRLPGIMPSWHLQQKDGTPLLPKNAGYCDVTLKKGWNSVLLKLVGAKYTQDVNFHLAQSTTGDPVYKAGPPYTIVSKTVNTAWRP